jgi:hypothetical protein
MLKLVFKVKSTKECMNIFLLLDPVFHMLGMVLVEWENCNILDQTKDVLTHPPTLIEKSTFGFLSDLK